MEDIYLLKNSCIFILKFILIQQELFNISENSSKAQVMNDGNDSTTCEQDNTHNSRGNEEVGALNSDVQQEITDEVSINSSSSTSSSGAEP